MKRVLLLITMCSMLVGCSNNMVKVKEIISEGITDIAGADSFNYATISVEINKDINDIDNLYSVIRSIDKEICDEIRVSRYDNVIVEIYALNEEYVGNMTIQNNKEDGITYDLSPIDELGEWEENIRIN